MRLRFGICPTEGGHFFGEALAEVERAEELGFDSVWVAEHHGVRDHYWPAPIQVLTALAARTSRLVLGANVCVFPFYHPVRLAEETALLDVVSGGRAVLGVAIGYKPDEFLLYDAALEPYVRQYGMTHVIFRLFTPGMPHRQILRQLELLAKEVLPAFPSPVPLGWRPRPPV